jgi:hypothetical protein
MFTDQLRETLGWVAASKTFNEQAIGVLGRAQRRFKVRCGGVVFLGNHYHLLLWVQDSEQLRQFMEYVNGNMARKVGRLVGWRDKIWARRYQAILVSEEERAQVARFRYVVAHGVKEGLVRHVRDWPGIHMARTLLDGEPLKGYWHNRTLEYADRQAGEGLSGVKVPDGGGAEAHSVALLGASVRRRGPQADRGVGGGGRAGGRRRLSRTRTTGGKSRRGSPPASPQLSAQDQEVTGSAVPRRDKVGEEGATERVLRLRGGVPQSRQEVEEGKPRGALPRRLLPASATVRARASTSRAIAGAHFSTLQM